MPARKEKPVSDGIKRITPFVKGVSGLKGLKVVTSIGDGATDEQIEDKTNFKMAEIRALLNQLHEHGVVEYNREKNLQTGWFTYTWRVNPERAFKNFIGLKKREHAALHQQLTAEENTVFYQCKKTCRKMAFDIAMETQFKCPKCDGKMNAFDNKKEIESLRKQLEINETILMKLGETPTTQYG